MRTVMFNMLATHQLQFIAILVLSLVTTLTCSAAATTSIPQELHVGFAAVPESSTKPFQAVLSDPGGNFSLGFLRVNKNQLALAVLHVASSEPFWVANPTHAASWSDTTRLFFNGSLVLSDPETRVSWSTATNGDRVVLLNTSNLQVHHKGTPLWESFHFPTNTLVQDQNFTSNMTLLSSNGIYSMRLSRDFMGLYEDHDLLYWKRSPLETKAEVKEGHGPIYARVNPEGYLGMYQTSDTKPADVNKFNTFQLPVTATSFLFVRLEQDGNLKAYYWDGSKWLLDFQAIPEACDLPRSCGSYGLCTPGGSGCSCLDNRTRFESGGCFDDVSGEGDFCSSEGIGGKSSYRVLRRTGVEPQHKELLSHVTTSSLAECEELCQNNCSCWGTLYNNETGTGFCYMLDYPIQTMLGTGDRSKVGYFKVKIEERGKNRVWLRVGIVVAVLVMVGVIIIGAGFRLTRWRKRGVKEEDWASPGPYKNLGSASFRSIEMSNTNTR